MDYSASSVASPRGVILPAAIGGSVAGTLDITSAFITYGWGIPKSIASGLLGAQAFHGGAAVWVLGVCLHFLIMFVIAAIYCLAARKWDFLKDHFVICGAFYGMGVFLVMELIVLPLSAVPFPVGPFTVAALIQGLLVHMILIGLPIAACNWKFSA
jgi:uncharacterized membrane protein YagU involved in acid resistance